MNTGVDNVEVQTIGFVHLGASVLALGLGLGVEIAEEPRYKAEQRTTRLLLDSRYAIEALHPTHRRVIIGLINSELRRRYQQSMYSHQTYDTCSRIMTLLCSQLVAGGVTIVNIADTSVMVTGLSTDRFRVIQRAINSTYPGLTMYWRAHSTNKSS